MKKIKIGVFGATRGGNVVNFFVGTGAAEVVAICDGMKNVLDAQKEYLVETLKCDNISFYSDFDEFIKHDMDAVILANFATEHAPYAIRCLDKGLHVYSEVLPCQTMKEAVELVEAVERSGKIYAYGENFCFMPAPYEMKKLYKEGLIGEFEYGEGEYIHDCTGSWASLTYGDKNHWSNNMYANFYCTHSIGPLIHITGLRPVSVVGFESKMNERKIAGGAKSGLFGIEMITLENGGIIKSIHGDLNHHSMWYLMTGSKGSVEAARHIAGKELRHHLYIRTQSLDANGEIKNVSENRDVAFKDENAAKSGHYGSDYIILSEFVKRISGDENADIIDVYEALDMFLPGMFAYRSVLQGGVSLEIPDLRNKEIRDQYRSDTMCTDPKVAGDMLIPSFSEGNPNIPDEVYDKMRSIWQKEIAEKDGYVYAAIKQGRLK